MPMANSVTRPHDEETDALYDTMPHALAVRFGLRTLQLLREGRPCAQAAHIAFHFGLLALKCVACGHVHSTAAEAQACCSVSSKTVIH